MHDLGFINFHICREKLHLFIWSQVMAMCILERVQAFLPLLTIDQRYTYRVLQTIQMKLTLLWVWAEQAVLGRAKTALKFKY